MKSYKTDTKLSVEELELTFGTLYQKVKKNIK